MRPASADLLSLEIYGSSGLSATDSPNGADRVAASVVTHNTG
jgi:hypothetical protein